MSALTAMLSKARRVLIRRGVPEQDAEELVQEAFLKIEHFEREHGARSREALLVTTAVNLSIDRNRREGRSPFAHVEDPGAIADTRPDPAQVIEQRARLRHAKAGIDTLSERTRRILLRRRLEGATYAEIAADEGMTVAAVEKQVARATLQLVRWMDGW